MTWLQTHYGQAIEFHEHAGVTGTLLIEDIAHALSHLCRFAGHTREFYSVAQHSVLVSRMVPREHALCGLLHDATEAYLVDVPKPLKLVLPDYQRLEHALSQRIAREFGCCVGFACAHEADARMLATEARDVMGPAVRDWALRRAPYEWRVEPWAPSTARRQLLLRYDEARRGR